MEYADRNHPPSWHAEESSLERLLKVRVCLPMCLLIRVRGSGSHSPKRKDGAP